MPRLLNQRLHIFPGPFNTRAKGKVQSFQRRLYELFVTHTQQDFQKAAEDLLEHEIQQQAEHFQKQLNHMDDTPENFAALQKRLQEHLLTDFFQKHEHTRAHIYQLLRLDMKNRAHRQQLKERLSTLLQDNIQEITRFLKFAMVPECLKYVKAEMRAEDFVDKSRRNLKHLNDKLIKKLQQEALSKYEHARFQGWLSIGILIFRLYESTTQLLDIYTKQDVVVPKYQPEQGSGTKFIMPR